MSPAESEIFEITLLPAHAQADGDDDKEIEEQNEAIDRELRVHPALGDRISRTRKVDRALRRAMLKSSIEVRAGLARLLDPPMDLTRIEAPDFDLATTLNSGQVFHWEKYGSGFAGAIGEIAIYVEQRGDILKVGFGETPKPTRQARALPQIVANYFALIIHWRNLRVVPARPGHGCGARFLPRPSNYSPAKMGMPGHLYLFFDETGGAHPANFAGAAPALWGNETNRRTGSLFISVARPAGPNDGE